MLQVLVADRWAPVGREGMGFEDCRVGEAVGKAGVPDHPLTSTTGDRYAGLWIAEQFGKFGITYTPSEKSKTDLYLDLLAALNSQRIALVDNTRLVNQIASLERKTTRGSGRDVIDHPPGPSFHDDLANCTAGLASLGISGGAYDGSYRGWRDDIDAESDPGVARAQRARARMQETIDRISQPPQPAWDLLAQIERLRRKGGDTNATTNE
jgi:hypothetical protein